MLFDVGDQVQASVIFLSDPNNLTSFADPSAVTVSIEPPGAGGVSYLYPDAHVVKDSVGHYHTVFSATVPKRWHVTWQGAGSLQATVTTSFLVSP